MGTLAAFWAQVKNSGSGTEVVAVNSVSFSAFNSHITALLGHNGAGKTTTMSVLTGRNQGCQMAYFQTRNPYFGKFWRGLQWKTLVYFMAVWSTLFYGHLIYLGAIWYIYGTKF
jgi:hypothetical protein